MDVLSRHVVVIPEQPLAPWMRLAHVHGATGTYGSVRSQLRVLSDFELILQLDGSSWIWSETDRGSVDVPAGSVAFIPPHFLNAWGSEAGTHIAVHFDLHAKPELEVPANMSFLGRAVTRRPIESIPTFSLRLWEPTEPLVIPLVTARPASQRLHAQFRTLVDVWSGRPAQNLWTTLQVVHILAEILETLGAPHLHHDREDARITKVLQDLDEALTLRTSVRELADQSEMAESAFRAAFVRAVGKPPRRYMEERRIEYAARALLETDSSVGEIGRAVGYTDPYHFSRVFRKVTGASPKHYRMQFRS